MKERTGGKVLTNMLSYLILQIINLLIGIVLPRMYLETYGSEVNGIISTINSFITYFAYIEAGLGLSLIHSLYKPLSENDSQSISVILSYSKKQYQKISYFYFAGVVFLSALFPILGGTPELTHIEFALLVLVIGLYGAFDFYSMAKYRVLLTADRKEYVISHAMIIAQILRFVFTWIVLQCDISVAFVKVVPILTLLVRTVILWIYIKRRYPYISFNVSDSPAPVATNNRWDALLLQISINTSSALPVLIVAQMLGYKEANVYAVYNLVISAVIAVVSALSSGVAPMFGKKIASNESVVDIYRTYEWSVSFVLTLIFSVCVVLILPFVKLYVDVVDDANYIFVSYAVLFSLWGALYSFRIPATAIINASALYKENRINNIVNLALQLVLGSIGAYFWGINGVLVAMILAALHRNISMAVVIEKKLISQSVIQSVKYQLVMCVVVFLSFVVGRNCIVVEKVTVANWLLSAAISVPLAAVFCVFVFVLINLKKAKIILQKLIPSKWKKSGQNER